MLMIGNNCVALGCVHIVLLSFPLRVDAAASYGSVNIPITETAVLLGTSFSSLHMQLSS